jgi:hypothetical protein
VVRAVAFGFEPSYLADLPVTSFNALVEDVIEVEARDKVERAWISMIAAQGKAENMKEQLKPWTDVMKRSGSRPKGDDKGFANKIKANPKLRGGKRGR